MTAGTDTMRIAVIGAGAVGGSFGAALAKAGNDVTFVARGAHLAAMRARGLSVLGPRGDIIRNFPAEMMPSMAVDLLRGNRLELPWLAGKMVALGREVGVPTPTFDVMYAALKPYANGAPA